MATNLSVQARWLMVCMVPAALVLLMAWQHGHGVPPPEAIAVPDSGTTVPMLDVGGRPAVEGSINGKGPYLMILDSGASANVLTPDLIQELALPAAPGLAGGALVRMTDLRIGDTTLTGVTAARISLLSALAGDRPPRGVLSASGFPGCLVTLDYPGKQVTIRKGVLPPADDRRVFQYSSEDMLPKVPIRIAGHLYHLDLDSGAPGGVTLPIRDEQDLSLSDAPAPVGQARTNAGEFPVFRASISGAVTLGEFSLDVTHIEFSDVRPGAAAPTGTIGSRVLGQFIVTLDATNRRVKLER
jgi:hypothetical protein